MDVIYDPLNLRSFALLSDWTVLSLGSHVIVISILHI